MTTGENPVSTAVDDGRTELEVGVGADGAPQEGVREGLKGRQWQHHPRRPQEGIQQQSDGQEQEGQTDGHDVSQPGEEPRHHDVHGVLRGRRQRHGAAHDHLRPAQVLDVPEEEVVDAREQRAAEEDTEGEAEAVNVGKQDLAAFDEAVLTEDRLETADGLDRVRVGADEGDGDQHGKHVEVYHEVVDALREEARRVVNESGHYDGEHDEAGQ